jgi:mono/diheme cytochrome c family protein
MIREFRPAMTPSHHIRRRGAATPLSGRARIALLRRSLLAGALLVAASGCLSVLPALSAEPAAPKPAAATPGNLEFFEKHVRPVLVERCVSCHGPRLQQGGLRLDRPDFLRAAGESGPVVRPGDPEGSRLIQAVRHAGNLKMPPNGKLPEAQIAALSEWVRAGAVWPSPTGPRPAGPAPRLAYGPLRRTPALPAARDRAWVRVPIDAFILAGLEKRGLKPAPPADRRTLIRRAYYDLIGLPPTGAEVEAFVADPAPDAYERLVDRLLASPHYGERWGRHWLDVARYADTRGYVRLQEERFFPYAYTYRDYVVRAFNEDKPYDRFILEQLAADQLPAGTADPAALGFLTLGRRFTGNRHDIIDDRIDVVTRGLLGLTVTCARCHDHKYDPVPTADYYSLYGVFAASEDPMYPPLLAPADAESAHAQEFERRRLAAEQREEVAFARLLDEFRARTGDYLVKALEGRQPPQQPLPHAPGEIRQLVVERWLDALQDGAERGDPVFAAWHAFAALEPARFPAQAAALVARWRAAGPGPKLHEGVREHFIRRPPRSMTDVARGYGELLERVHEDAEARRWAAEDGDSGLRNGSFESDGPTQNASPRGWKLTGARLAILDTEGSSHGRFAAVFGDGLPSSSPPTGHTAELTQVVRTAPGAEYRLTFDYGAFGAGTPETEQSLRAEVRGRTVLAARNVTARGSIPSILRPYELRFTADGPSVTLAFADATANGESGLADGVLDHVRLALVRLPAGVAPPGPPAEPSPGDRELLALLHGPTSPLALTRNQALDNYLYDAPVNAELVRLRNAAGAWLAQTATAPPRAHTLVEIAPAPDARVLVRGNPQRPGRRVPRQFLAALSPGERRPFAPATARLDLARELVRPDNPLTARVLVNRVWQHHFGQGLVRTPSDFGLRGEAPTHPALLDWLAATFLGAPGSNPRHSRPWSLKGLHRLIMLSSTYRQSSRETQPLARLDPENRLLGRANRRRLDVESFRDSVLFAAGRLDLRLGGPSEDLLRPENRRRTLYAAIDRQNLPGVLRLFDFANPDAHTAQRHLTTVPLQALFLLNSPFMEGAAGALAARAVAGGGTPVEQARSLYRHALARDPTPSELARALRLLAQDSATELAQALLLSNEFAFVD